MYGIIRQYILHHTHVHCCPREEYFVLGLKIGILCGLSNSNDIAVTKVLIYKPQLWNTLYVCWPALQPWFCEAEIGQLFFLLYIFVPHINKTQPTFQGVPGNTGLTLMKNTGRNQRKYIIFHIDEHQIHLPHRDLAVWHFLSKCTQCKFSGVGNKRVNLNKKIRIVELK